ncbi:histidinol-phosphate transaminase [Flavobacteriaceae bacterium]|nr:histidinol-phosphate transaminase [Flavobacteriaceae bacterium]MDA9294333.1 histidinol-phosphate transaminase [Flavobacteriaceae bacterium]MDA9887067.1 histidinol-phosphate transaminase [Flavobacteriaceae bacterium]MDB4112959.1 histidinol-phosphate transaminase [Flavobacteriaceae bacterium]MDB9886216.1 histidinol-phosphate transaminase [Flavobacteriaceae bacterium]
MNSKDQILAWARPEIVALKPYASARSEFKLGEKQMILLDANENPFDNGMNRYPDPMQLKLKKRLAEAKHLAIDQIFLGNGSDDVLNQLMIAFCAPGKDKAVLLPPTFGMYQVCANINGVETIEVPLTDDFHLDIKAISEVQSKATKIIFIANPNNPTGNCFALEDIRKIIEEFDGLVVVDEAYVEFATDKSVISWINDYHNLIVVQTFSKAQGLAGLRLGMAFAHSAIIDLMNKVKAPYNINSLTQKEILKRLEEQGLIQQQVHRIKLEKEQLMLEFESISFIEKVFPSDANFFLIRMDDSTQRYNELIDRGIVVRDSSKNLNCANTLRITVGTPDENNALIIALRSMDK